MARRGRANVQHLGRDDDSVREHAHDLSAGHDNCPRHGPATRRDHAAMAHKIDLTGKVFGRWTVLKCAGTKGKSRHQWWTVQCSCPRKTIKDVVGTSLTNGNSKSCGCLVVEVGKRNRKHGWHGTPEYQAWLSARKRTRDPNCPEYPKYGGRTPPITMSDELYDSCELFIQEAGGKRPTPNHSVDRIDTLRGYERGNLKWSTPKEQALNRRDNRYLEHEGLRLTHSQWDDKKGFRRGTVKNRVNLGWSAEKIFSTPVRYKTPKKPRPFTGEVEGEKT
jgi:hypothetical protein